MSQRFETSRGKTVIYNKGKADAFQGEVIDDAFYEEKYDGNGKDFVDLVQYILWESGNYGIRICYYWREHGSVNWKFSMKALSTSPDMLREFLKEAKKKEWFAELL